MTHQADHSTLDSALELISSNGLNGLAEAIRLLVNESMKLERAEFLRAGPHERSKMVKRKRGLPDSLNAMGSRHWTGPRAAPRSAVRGA